MKEEEKIKKNQKPNLKQRLFLNKIITLSFDNYIHPGEPLPGVYARVSSVVGWIESKISSGRTCRKPTAIDRTVLVQPSSSSTERPGQSSFLGNL